MNLVIRDKKNDRYKRFKRIFGIDKKLLLKIQIILVISTFLLICLYLTDSLLINYSQGSIWKINLFLSGDIIDYPDFIHPLAKAVNDGKYKLGIILCGSGNGVCMTANKYNKVRAGLSWNKEVAELIRLHNNANILCIPARFVSIKQALMFVEIFLNTKFEGGRHQTRIDKIPLSC